MNEFNKVLLESLKHLVCQSHEIIFFTMILSTLIVLHIDTYFVTAISTIEW